MPPEQQQNQYYEQAKIAQDVEMKQQIMEAMPSSEVDFKQLEDDLLKKIDEVAGVGKRALNKTEYKHWREAQKQVKEAVKQLKNVQKFFRDRWEVRNIKDLAKDIKSGSAPDYTARTMFKTPGLSEVPGIHEMVMMQDFEFLADFVNKDVDYPDNMAATVILATFEALDARKLLADVMSKRFKETIPKEVRRLTTTFNDKAGRVSTGLDNMTILEYSDFEVSIETLMDTLDSIDKMAKMGDAAFSETSLLGLSQGLVAQARDTLTVLKGRLVLTRASMDEPERLALEKRDKALEDLRNKKPKAGERFAKASEEANFMVGRQQVEEARVRALAFGNNPKQFQAADEMFKNAQAAVKSGDGLEASRLFYGAMLAFREAEKPVPVVPQKRKAGPDERLARR